MMPTSPCSGCGQDNAPFLQFANRFTLSLLRLSCAKCGRHTQWYKAEEQHDMEVAWSEEELASPSYDELDVYHRLGDAVYACGAVSRAIDTLMERKDVELSRGIQALLRDAKARADETLRTLSDIEHSVEDWVYPQDEEDDYPEVDYDDY